MIQSTKWYGLTARTPEEYFYNNCHSYADISDVIDRKGTGILRDITPAIESFIQTNEQVAPDAFMEKLIRINDSYSKNILKDTIRHTIDNCASLESVTDSLWPIWLDMPRIQHNYTLGKITESAKNVLNRSLGEFADRVVGNLSSFTSSKVDAAVESFVNNVDYNKMLKWKDCRESVMKTAPLAAYVGDMIVNLSEEDWPELAIENVMPEIDATLQGVAERMGRRDVDTEYSTESFRNIVDDMWGHFVALESTDDAKVEIVSYYNNTEMTVTPIAYSTAIMEMAIANCFPSSICSAIEQASRELCRDWDSSIGTSTKYQEYVTEKELAMPMECVMESGLMYVDDDVYRELIEMDDILMDYDAMESAKGKDDDDEDRGEKVRETVDKVKDTAHKVSREVKKGATHAKNSIHKMYRFWKDNEKNIDAKLTGIVKKAGASITGDPAEMREEIIEGKCHSIMSILKKIIGGWAVFAVSPVAFLIGLIVRLCNRGKIRRSEKRRMVMDLESELAIVDEKIRDAAAEGNKEAKYQLMRTRATLEQGIKRIRSGDEAIKGGIGTREISKMR